MITMLSNLKVQILTVFALVLSDTSAFTAVSIAESHRPLDAIKIWDTILFDSNHREVGGGSPEAFQNTQMNNNKSQQMNEKERLPIFVKDEELIKLRSDIAVLRHNLKWALASDDIHRLIDLYDTIEKAECKDPEVVYKNALQKVIDARKLKVGKKYEAISKYSKEAEVVRKLIPRLNLEGLWVGDDGEHQTKLINVTYSGDTLIAKEVTETSRGEIIFKANLGPNLKMDESDSEDLTLLQIAALTASKSGSDKTEKYKGLGRIGKKDFVNGQLIMGKENFSFLWNPTRRNILFRRPDANLTLRLMRDTISEEDEIHNIRDHIERCYEKDISTAFIGPSQQKEISEPFRRIHRSIDLISDVEERRGVVVDNRKNSTLSFNLPFLSSDHALQLWAEQFKRWKDTLP